MEPQDEPRRALARRLRALRQKHWPDVDITQQQLASALRVSVPSVSSWESEASPKPPPAQRLRDYATFFATRRSVEGDGPRLLADDELTDDEQAARARLEDELLALRDAFALDETTPPHNSRLGLQQSLRQSLGDGGPLQFPEDQTITIVCAPLPADIKAHMLPFTDPDQPDYVELYTYADLDALIEMHGHIRAVNPNNRVHIRSAANLQADDITTHLILLGGVDWNGLTRDVLSVVDLPVAQVARVGKDEAGAFVVRDGADERRFAPRMRISSTGRTVLAEDVAHVYRGTSPFNRERTVTMFNGMYGRGVLGAVRTLTDARFRDRNADYLRSHLAPAGAVSILARARIVRGEVLTPDWTLSSSRLHVWSEDDQ